MRILLTGFRGSILQLTRLRYSLDFPLKLPSISKSWAAFATSSNVSGRPRTDFEDPTSSCFDQRFQNILKKLSNHNQLNLSPQEESLAPNERLSLISHVLRSCASKGSVNEGNLIHGQVVKNGLDADFEFCFLLVKFYGKCGIFGCALKVIDEMRKRDVMFWNALIAELFDEGCYGDVIKLYCEMRKGDVVPNGFGLVTALKACSVGLELDFGTQLHVDVIKFGLDINVGFALVDLYVKCGVIELAEKVFFYMPEKSAESWNVLLDGFALMGKWEEVLILFNRVKQLDLKFGKFTLLTVIKSCARLGDLSGGQVLHTLLIKNGCEFDKFLSSCLLDMYSKCGLADDALKIFERIRNPNVVAWSAMINCLDQQGQSREAAELFCLMRRTNVHPNQFTFAIMVSSATNMGDHHHGESIHACVLKYGFESDYYVCNALIIMYMRFGLFQNGWRVFDVVSMKDIALWNALLSGLCDGEACDQGPSVFKQLIAEGFRPDVFTFVSILRSCSSCLSLDFGKQVHAHIVKNNLNKNSSVGTVLVSMYIKGSPFEDAADVVLRLIDKDLLTWTVLISSYAQTDQGEQAMKYLNQMRQEGFKPNQFTISSCLNGCSSLTMLACGRQLHSLALRAGLSSDVYVASSLVDMYAKCRCIDDAEAVFEGLAARSKVSWNTIILAYSQHGFGKKALKAFNRMSDEGFVPDEITFIGVLSACSHLGLVHEGKMHFNSLNKDYGITPSIEHCACMVSILSRVGKFSEVERFIKERKLTDNSLIWETILWACKIHGNVEFGERAAKRLLELEPTMDYNCIMLSHIYAANGRWDDVAKVRELMSKREIKKEPGCSWLEVDAQIHAFLAQDESHPTIKEIRQTLEGLNQ
ncbi:hypothetical protein UlMin_022624 [Ulmus minor]